MAACAAFASPPVGLPDWSAGFAVYPAAARTPGLPDGLAPSEAEVCGLACETASRGPRLLPAQEAAVNGYDA